MTATPTRPLDWNVVDAAYNRQLHGTLPARWLLVQTLATSPSRRALLGSLGVPAGAKVIDVGTGFGPIPLELCGMGEVHAVGIDRDEENLAVARRLAAELGDAGWLRPEGSLTFTEGDAYDLPVEDDEFDLATSRLLFQHLDDPSEAADELYRVVKPGGGVCVIDVDDALALTYPEPSDAFLRLQQAFRQLQETKGGDRFVGRKLSSYLERAGFTIISLVVLPQTAHGPSTPTDAGRVFALERLRTVRDEAIAAGVISADEFAACYDQFAGERLASQCAVEAHLAVVGHKPA